MIDKIINECHEAKSKGNKRDYEQAINNIVSIVRDEKGKNLKEKFVNKLKK